MATTLTHSTNELEHLVKIRHEIHAHPELGYDEHQTSKLVQESLKEIGVQFKADLAGGTGVLGWLPATENPDSAQTVALRADMDALPILEATGLPYASTNPGKMHACGHDGHTTVLIGTARRLATTSHRPNNVLFLFQPAEEGGAGGDRMVQEGALSGDIIGRPVDRIFGLHGTNMLNVGQAATRPGAMMASADGFEVVIKGKGCHAAMPHAGIDPIVAAAHIITALQTIASRNVSPLDSIVVTVGVIKAGSASNIIPETAEISATLRTLKASTREFAMKQIPLLISKVAEGLGAQAETRWTYGYPVTVNDPQLVPFLRKTIAPELEDGTILEDTEPVMGAEDFSFYGRDVPACFYWLGLKESHQESYPNLHSPKFDFNDKAIPYGVAAMSALALAVR